MVLPLSVLVMSIYKPLATFSFKCLLTKPLQPSHVYAVEITHERRFSRDIIIWRRMRMKSASEASLCYFSICISSCDPVGHRRNEILDFSGILGWQLFSCLFHASCLFRPVMYFSMLVFFQCSVCLNRTGGWIQLWNGSRETRSLRRTNVTDSWFSAVLKYNIPPAVCLFLTQLHSEKCHCGSSGFMVVSCDTVVDTVCWDAEASV